MGSAERALVSKLARWQHWRVEGGGGLACCNMGTIPCGVGYAHTCLQNYRTAIQSTFDDGSKRGNKDYPTISVGLAMFCSNILGAKLLYEPICPSLTQSVINTIPYNTLQFPI